MQNQTLTIYWLRRDLRLANNPALQWAVAQAGSVLPIYIEPDWTSAQPGAASRWWCYESLRKLALRYADKGLALQFFKGDPLQLIPEILQITGATRLCWNNLYEPSWRECDEQLESSLPAIEVKRFDSHLLFQPGSILNQQGLPYRVFTPFWKTLRARLEVSGVNISKTKKHSVAKRSLKPLQQARSLEELGLLDQSAWHMKLANYWTPGEEWAHKRLNVLLKSIVSDYEVSRDIPGEDGTSKLSASLHFGEITAAQIIYKIQQSNFKPQAQASVERYMTELGWREFAHHILWHFPHTVNQPMNEKYKNFWSKRVDKNMLHAWQSGHTGVSLVDAGMRQLWETGWMHNRVRMIVASYLTKNLGIHWLQGANWFWDTLVDADLANNTLGWQWVAGCGVDAAPYYRIFNPETQAQRFDPEKKYIRQWQVHKTQNNITPLVDLKKSREQALARYKKL